MRIFGRWHHCFIALFFLLGISTVVSANTLKIPAFTNTYVNDYAHLLNAAQVQSLNKELHQFDQQTSNQIVVATFGSLNGESLEDFSVHLAQQWKIGSHEHDNGVLLLIIKDSHDIRIEVGYGLEGVLTDAVSDLIIRHDIAPNFKMGNYYQGIQNGVNAIMQVTQGEYKGASPRANGTNSIDGPTAFLFFLVLIVVIRAISFGSQYSSLRGTLKDHSRLKAFFWLLLYFFLSSGSGRGGGSGGSGNDDDDSFSGGGGGFGGGGASGKW